MAMSDPVEQRARTKQAVALILPATLAVMASAALAPALPQLFRAFGGVPGAAWLVPMVLTLPAVLTILVSPVAGWLGDRYGRRRLLIAGLILYAAFGLAAMLIDNLYVLLADRALVGIAEAMGMTLSTTLIGDAYSGAERDRWLGYQVALAAFSAIIYIALGGFLAGFGWRAAFAIYATPLLFALLVALWTREPAKPARDILEAAAFPWRAMAVIWPVSLLGGVLFYTAQLQAGLALDAIGLPDPRWIGLVLAGVTIATVTGSLIFRKLVGWPSLGLLSLSFGLLGVGFVVIAQAGGVAALAGGLAIAQFGCGLLLPTAMRWAIQRLPFALRGRGTGTWQGIFSFGQFLSPLIVTGIAQGVGGDLRHGGVQTAFGMLGAVALVATFALVIAWRRSRGGAPRHLARETL